MIVTQIKQTLSGPCVSADQGACAKATFVSVVLQKWYSPRGSVAMVRSAPGARGRPSREERGGRSAEAHTRTGTMEKRAPLSRIFPSNGTRVFIWLLILQGLTRECTSLFVFLYAPVFVCVCFLNPLKEVVAALLGVSLDDTEHHAGLFRVVLKWAVFRSEPASLEEANGIFF